MLTSLALIFLVGLAMAGLSRQLKLPRLIGMLLTGILLGPFVLDFLDPKILAISSELRQIALIIILIKAGLSLNLADLRKVGRPALLMSFVPATLEILAFVLFGPLLLGLTRLEGAIVGAVLGAVSPAVVVPKMVELIEKRYGTAKKIPQLLLAASSLDDVFVIVVFSAFLAMEQGHGATVMDFANIPVAIVLGLAGGWFSGWLLAKFFALAYKRGLLIRNSTKVIIISGQAFLLLAMENWLQGVVAFSGLLAIMSMAMALAAALPTMVNNRLKEKFGKIWLPAELLLFVLVGAAVDIRYTLDAGPAALLLLLIGLLFRSLGVYLSLLGTPLTNKERLFAILAYIPKATVQAAIGGIPLAMNLPCGKIVLSVAVLSIIITAPLGALAIDATYKKTLTQE